MRINNNISALTSYNSLNSVNRSLTKSIRRLSAGLRINSAADDAAGLAISEKMRAQIRGLDQASRNAQDGISMVQTAEGALESVHSILQRMKELSVQAANDTLTQQDRAYIQQEIDELTRTVDGIADTTQFNGKKLLNGTSDALWSTDTLGVRVNIKGSLLSRDRFNQTERTEGNYRVVISADKAGQGQVLKSSIFTHIGETYMDTGKVDENGEPILRFTGNRTVIAGKNSKLSELQNFYDKNGNFLLTDPQTITLSFENGGSASVIIYGSDTIEDLGSKLNEAAAKAGGVPAGGSAAQWVGRAEHADLKAVASMANKFKDEATAKLADMLMTGLLEASAERIKDIYGLDGRSGKNLTIEWANLGGDTIGQASAAPGGSDIKIQFDRDYFQNMTDADIVELRLTTLHEMTHAMQFASHPNGVYEQLGSYADPKDAYFLLEGMTEYAAQGNYRVRNTPSLDTVDKIVAAMAIAVGPGYGRDSQEYYSTSYLAARFLDEKATGGVKAFIAQLDGGKTTNEAFAAVTTWTNLAAFRNAITDAASNTDFKTFAAKVLSEPRGAGLAGTTLNRTELADSLADKGYKDNPLAAYGYDSITLFGEKPPFMLVPDEPDVDETWGGLSYSLAKSGTLQSVNGTLLLHSGIAGSAGKMTLSGSEALINALGFAEVQSARDTEYSVSVYDAHSGKSIANNVSFSGGTMYGVIHEQVDVSITDNFALSADGSGTMHEGYGSFDFGGGTDEFIVHIADNSTVLQVGANEGENFIISFGDISAHALGIDNVRVTSRELASRAMTKIDDAITEVSRRRARIGVYVNRLDYTISTLMTTAANLTASESGIRDLDMAKEMMNFMKLQILSQSGTSMLAQANQLPQNVLSLVR